MKEPFNSQAPHFMTKVKAYCAKVLPLVFDNSLSYYEFLAKMCHKLNECIDALNAHHLNIIEFTHMVQLEIEKFEKYIDNRITEFENELKSEWAQFKEEIKNAFEAFKQQMESEWAAEKKLNEKFRNDLLNEFNELKADIIAEQKRFENQMKADFNTFKENVNALIEQFEQATNADLSAFKNTMQTQQNEFEAHMVELFNNFKTTEKQARTDFESNFQHLFEQWKIDTLHALNEAITGWETDTQSALTEYINEKLSEFKHSLTNAVTALQNDISNERLARTQADSELQRQINELTPEGSIKADTPDSDGNSQLYTIDKTTQQRTNIFPKTNTPTEGTIKADTPDSDGNSQLYTIDKTTQQRTNIFPKTNTPTSSSTVKFLTSADGVAVNSSYFYIADSKNSFILANSALVKKDVEIIDGILIPTSLIGDTTGMSPNQALLTLDISIMPCSSLLDTPVYMLNIYIDHVKFVEYNTIKYLSLPIVLNFNPSDNSTALGQNRIKCIVTIKKYTL